MNVVLQKPVPFIPQRLVKAMRRASITAVLPALLAPMKTVMSSRAISALLIERKLLIRSLVIFICSRGCHVGLVQFGNAGKTSLCHGHAERHHVRLVH